MRIWCLSLSVTLSMFLAEIDDKNAEIVNKGAEIARFRANLKAN